MEVDEDPAGSSTGPLRREFMVLPQKVGLASVRVHVPTKGYGNKLELLGSGSYGTVFKGILSTRSGQHIEVAIKKFHQPFQDVSSARRLYRELRLLQCMDHENVIRAIDMFTPDKEPTRLEDIYVVTEYAGRSLSQVVGMRTASDQRLLSDEHIRFIVYQLLRALKYIHSASVVHRDLKPSNLAVTERCDLTVLDFGLARSLEPTGEGAAQQALTTYVMTRWYRSPEVLYFNLDAYTAQIDMWAVGCIAAELKLGSALFRGEDVHSQYEMICQTCGSPDEQLLQRIPQDVANLLGQMRPRYQRKTMESIFGAGEPIFNDFIDRILVLDPARRMTVVEALAHDYVRAYSQPDDDPESPHTFVVDDPPDAAGLSSWRKAIFDLILGYRPNEEVPV